MLTLRQKTAQILDSTGHYAIVGRLVNIFFIGIVFINIIAIIVESVEKNLRHHEQVFAAIEFVSITIFTFEYAIRLWSCVDSNTFEDSTENNWKIRLRYMLTPLAIIDLIVILPAFLFLLGNLDLRFLRAFWLLRVFKLGRYSPALQLMHNAVKDQMGTLFAAFVIMSVVLVVASCGIYLIEGEVQPDKFGSIPLALWWAVVTLTTVGYGDVIPITALGKFFGGVITLLSMGMVAIPTGLLVSSFSEQLRKRKTHFINAINDQLVDGKLSDKSIRILEEKRFELGISKHEAMVAMEEAKAKKQKNFCTNCGERIN